MNMNQNTLSLPNNAYLPVKQILAFASSFVRLTLLLAYLALPMWGSWLAYQNNYYEISSHDMLIAIAWMPISSAIIALSIMKFGRKHLFKSIFTFIILNGIAISALLWMLL